MLELAYNEETKEWEQKKEPFITIEVETEEDFEFIGNAIAFYKKNIADQEKPKTRADRIRAMSDEELARFLAEIEWECNTYDDCAECPRMTDYGCVSLLRWLKQPA